MRSYIICFLLFILSSPVLGRYISPLEYGLKSAKNGVETYYVLLKTHEAAVSQRCNITYKGIEKLEIEIPTNAVSIPLPQIVDFHGVKMIVKNNSKFFPLFSLSQTNKPIDIDKQSLSFLKFNQISELAKGLCLLVVKDNKPWVEKRGGYNYGTIRKDIVVVKRGKGMNNVAYSYDTKESMPQMFYVKVNRRKKEYSNLYFERTADSKCVTCLIKIVNQYNVSLKNISIKTPKSDLYEDCAIQVSNCANVTFKDVTIDGSYSSKNKYGYGISMNNVYDSRFIRLKGRAEWGIFGNYNVNKAFLKDCDINRFDIHCYGKDVYCVNTVFRDWYNQFSSFYGILSFDGCKFIHFVPVLFEPSFSAYTPFTIKINNCKFEVDIRRPYLIDAGFPSNMSNVSRGELSTVNWPNIEIDGLEVNLPRGLDGWYLFWVNGKETPIISGLTSVRIKNLAINGETQIKSVPLANKPIVTEEDLLIEISSSNDAIIINN